MRIMIPKLIAAMLIRAPENMDYSALYAQTNHSTGWRPKFLLQHYFAYLSRYTVSCPVVRFAPTHILWNCVTVVKDAETV